MSINALIDGSLKWICERGWHAIPRAEAEQETAPLRGRAALDAIRATLPPGLDCTFMLSRVVLAGEYLLIYHQQNIDEAFRSMEADLIAQADALNALLPETPPLPPGPEESAFTPAPGMEASWNGAHIGRVSEVRVNEQPDAPIGRVLSNNADGSVTVEFAAGAQPTAVGSIVEFPGRDVLNRNGGEEIYVGELVWHRTHHLRRVPSHALGEVMRIDTRNNRVHVRIRNQSRPPRPSISTNEYGRVTFAPGILCDSISSIHPNVDALVWCYSEVNGPTGPIIGRVESVDTDGYVTIIPDAGLEASQIRALFRMASLPPPPITRNAQQRASRGLMNALEREMMQIQRPDGTIRLDATC